MKQWHLDVFWIAVGLAWIATATYLYWRG